MERCKFRIPVKKGNGNRGVEAAMTQALKPLVVDMVISGQLNQKFKCGLCEILTANDIGPVECQQPNHSESTCPDIDHLREPEESNKS
jgi:hypothetical protein